MHHGQGYAFTTISLYAVLWNSPNWSPTWQRYIYTVSVLIYGPAVVAFFAIMFFGRFQIRIQPDRDTFTLLCSHLWTDVKEAFVCQVSDWLLSYFWDSELFSVQAINLFELCIWIALNSLIHRCFRRIIINSNCNRHINSCQQMFMIFSAEKVLTFLKKAPQIKS